MTTLTLDEWNAEGERRFGADRMAWRFVCPGCGHVQAVEEFKALKDAGAEPNDAYLQCIGRFADANRRRKWLGGNGPGPCDYASFGLFCISPVTVTPPDGKPVRVFAFADRLGEARS